MKKIEVNLGVGINMFFPEPVTIVIEDEVNDEPVKKKVSKPKMKETAVEWLLSMLDYNQQMLGTKEIIEQAKEMEKEQSHAEYMRGWKDGLTKQQEQWLKDVLTKQQEQ
jgi:hypothetical protein